MTERKTESFVDKLLSINGYNDINYQGSEDKNIQSLLTSKNSGKKGKGRPEYTIKLNGISSDLLVIEVKKDKKFHSSAFTLKDSFTEQEILNLDLKFVKDYSVDGILWYMVSLIHSYNVVGLAISGSEENNLEISTFITHNGIIKRTEHKSLKNAQEYIKILKSNDYKINENLIISNIQKELPILHNELRDKMKLSEQEKPLLISACLLALQDESFKVGFKLKTTSDGLAKYTYDEIENSLTNILKIPQQKVKMMMGNFLFLKNNENVKKDLKYILEKVCFLFDSFSFSETSYDIIGNFYNEFLKYTGGDRQGLGIVLTPKHITDLFCKLADLNVNSVVLDTCTGTGAFLISAMKNMIELAKKLPNSEILIDNIKKKQLIGVEQDPRMFTLACSNMILRNDGKSNMFNSSCFDSELHEQIKKLKPNVCLINPPYSQKEENESELSFIKNALNLLETNGKLIAIVPISCGIEMSSIKIQQRRDILEKHTLEAVFSMPDELFYPVATNACIMVFTAHKPHGFPAVVLINQKPINIIQAKKPTFFGYWKNDGFVKSKKVGRSDRYGLFNQIEKEWLEEYSNNQNINGKAVVQKVSEIDEWCCEAYMTIDYSKINENDFDHELRKYLAFEVMNKGCL